MAFSAPSPSSSDSHSDSLSSYSVRNSNHTSPHLLSSDLGLDPSDPLNLLLHNTSQRSGDTSGDSSMEDSSQRGSPPDWSQLSNLWPSHLDGPNMTDENKYSELMDFDLSTVDMDFNPSMSIEPSALHFDSAKLHYNYDSYPLSNELLTTQFPFSFTPNLISSNGDFTQVHLQPPQQQQQQQQRRLSITSSSSSSGASLSPIMETSPTVPAPTLDDPAAELAHRVRQSAGVMLAVPMHGPGQGHIHTHHHTPNAPPTTSNQTQSKLPIPRNPRPTPASAPAPAPSTPSSKSSANSSAASTPPPTTPPSQMDAPNTLLANANGTATAPQVTGTSRPKTSHTTIERRYRTNLNARIQSLRMAVPALRVLEESAGKKMKGGKKSDCDSVEGEGSEGSDVVDVVDERGFVDGVRVARKCSKANVLGKAVEYIRVLKRREHRLKREQNGLKALLTGLVGGAALLKEWEREWFERFGGEEKDEVEGCDIADEGGSDDDGSADDMDNDEGEERSRKRKRIKVSVGGGGKKPVIAKEKEKKVVNHQVQVQIQTQVVAGAPGTIVPEKRKRGRPRKVVIPPSVPASIPAASKVDEATTSPQDVDQDPSFALQLNQQSTLELQQPQTQPQQFFLATFALFSFFNSPLTSRPSPHAHAHAHTGTVLSHTPAVTSPSVMAISEGWGWRECVQAFHLLVSFLVFASIVAPWLPLPGSSKRRLGWMFGYNSTSTPRSSDPASATLHSAEDEAPVAGSRKATHGSLVAALAPGSRGVAGEAEALRTALGVGVEMGLTDIGEALLGALWKGDRRVGFEQTGLEQRAWMRLGEICVLGGPVTIWARLRTYWHMRAHISWFTASARDLCTLALVVWPLRVGIARGRARALWKAARSRKEIRGAVGGQMRPFERLVLESMGVEEAFERLGVVRKSQGEWEEEWEKCTPIGVLGCVLVRERIRRHLQVLFVKTVLPAGQSEDGQTWDREDGADILDEEREEVERKRTIDAARSLGGQTEELGDVLERVWKTGVSVLEDVMPPLGEGQEEVGGVIGEIRALLSALILYRRIFPSSILGTTGASSEGCGVSILLSPPPSPSRKDIKLHYALRRALGSGVFDFDGVAEGEASVGGLGVALEDARDRVVDMLVESERRGRSVLQ